MGSSLRTPNFTLRQNCGMPFLLRRFSVSMFVSSWSVPTSTTLHDLFRWSYRLFMAHSAACFIYSLSSKMICGSSPLARFSSRWRMAAFSLPVRVRASTLIFSAVMIFSIRSVMLSVWLTVTM